MLQTILKTRNELIQVNLKKARLILESVNSIDIKTKKIFQVANRKNLTELQQLKSKLESVNTALKQNYEKQSRELFKQKLANYYNLPKQNYKWGSNVNTKIKKYVDRRPDLVL